MVYDDAVQEWHESGLEEAVNGVEPDDKQEEGGTQHGEEDSSYDKDHQHSNPVFPKLIPC